MGIIALVALILPVITKMPSAREEPGSVTPAPGRPVTEAD
jgi:hypothetical protein